MPLTTKNSGAVVHGAPALPGAAGVGQADSRAGEVNPRRGWFAVDGLQSGDRTLAEQLTGLDPVLQRAPGQAVLDLGCAEGLIARTLVQKGARSADGLSVIWPEIALGRRLCQGLPVRLWCADLNEIRAWEARHPGRLAPRYGIVLLLSILHKLKDPAALLAWALDHASDLAAIRLPAPVIADWRSDHRPFDVRAAIAHDAHFSIVAEPEGPRGEWLAIIRRDP